MENLLLTKSLGNHTIELNNQKLPIHVSYKVWHDYTMSYEDAVGDCKDLIPRLESEELLVTTIEVEASLSISEAHCIKESDTLGACIIKSSLDHSEITEIIESHAMTEIAIEGLRERLNDILDLLT
jgi:hypothetical protein